VPPTRSQSSRPRSEAGHRQRAALCPPALRLRRVLLEIGPIRLVDLVRLVVLVHEHEDDACPSIEAELELADALPALVLVEDRAGLDLDALVAAAGSIAS